MAIYETIDRKRAEAKEMKNKSASMEELETPTNSVKSFQMSSTRFVERPTTNSQSKTFPSKIKSQCADNFVFLVRQERTRRSPRLLVVKNGDIGASQAPKVFNYLINI